MEKVREEQENQEQEETLATPGVIDKYQDAAKIANFVLQKVIDKVAPGIRILEICEYGDKLIVDELSKVYNTKKRVEKGPAFPTCISVNEICGHFSPLKSEGADYLIKDGDVVKIDLGVHIDGLIALVAHTVVATIEKEVEGRKADVILAAYNALQASLRHLKPGGKNTEVTETISKVTEIYQVNTVEGVLSHELKKHLIDGNNVIIGKETFDQKVDEHEFQVNEVFALDVIVSSGDGKPKESEYRTTVYKRAIERTYTLKTKNARSFFNEVIEKYPTLCFSLRAFEDEISAKIGVSESVKHDLLVPYPVLVEKSGDIVAQFKVTVLILKNGPKVITGLPIVADRYRSEHKLTDEIQKLIETPLSVKKEKKKKEELKE